VKNMKPRDIALIALLSASITAGKFVLSFVPNVEIVTLLFIVYTVSFGLKRSLLVSVVFATTEILIYGFSTWVIGYYIVWPVLIIVTWLMRNRFKSEFGYAAIAGIHGFAFGAFFAVFESFFYGWAYGFAYWLRGILFDVVHGVSNYIIVLLLFKPLGRIVKIQAERFFAAVN